MLVVGPRLRLRAVSAEGAPRPSEPALVGAWDHEPEHVLRVGVRPVTSIIVHFDIETKDLHPSVGGIVGPQPGVNFDGPLGYFDICAWGAAQRREI